MFGLKLLCLSHLLLCVYAVGELSILQNPDSIIFSGQEQLDLSTVKNVLSSSMGFTIPEGPRWSGMVMKDPFNFAEGVVIVSVPGIASLDSIQGRTFPLNTDESLDNTWHSLASRLADRFPAVENLTINHVNVNDPSSVIGAYGELSPRESPTLEFLKLSVSEDKTFIDQINTIDAITSMIADKSIVLDGIPDLHWFTVPGLHSLVDMYGTSSKQVLEAKRLLSTSVLLLSEVFTTAYNDKMLFAVMSSDAIHTRRYRRDTAINETATTLPTPTIAPVPYDDDEDFPAMFNIFLWTGVTFVFVLLAVSVGIAQMDPGRDSIIYRMTSQRMKKDN